MLGSVETRFASQIYSCERILKDKDSLRGLFSSPKLLAFLARHPDLQVEYESLSNDFIYNQKTWERIGVFVAVEVPIRTMLRISDGRRPNLAQISPLFDQAKTEAITAAIQAESKYPLVFNDLCENCRTYIEKRKKDIVSLLCLAASMVFPKHVYVTESMEVYNPDGGQAAIMDVINRYYTSGEEQIQAISTYNNFRNKSGDIFGLPRTFMAATSFPPDTFWSVASNMENSIGCDLFRKLVNGYSGQGESERMNKQVKKFRTTNRNRRTQIITSSYMELDTTYRMINSRNKGPNTKPYIDCLRDKFFEIAEDVREEAERVELDRALREEVLSDDEHDDESDDVDYTSDVPDLGRDAFVELLRAAASLRECDDLA